MEFKPKKNLSAVERVDWIRLARSENIGSVTFFKLLEIFGDAKNALENVSDFSKKAGGKPLKVCSHSLVENEITQTEKIGAKILLFVDDYYPRLLREIYDPAPILTARGRTELLNQDSIGIVGPRNATFHACKFSEKIAADLGENGVTIISGLAKGVDASAHRGALKTGTVAVIAGGVDNIYPSENKALFQQIYNEGVVITEIPFGLLPRGSNFIQRNRVISGMSYGVVVAEAGMQSGSLTTARFALEQGRDVFAVPGSPMDPRCLGSNMLLEDGAIFTQNAAKVLREIPSMRGRFSSAGMLAEPDLAQFAGPLPKMPSDSDIAKVREEILTKIGFIAITIEEIIAELQAPARLVNIALVQLELAEKISVSSGRVLRK